MLRKYFFAVGACFALTACAEQVSQEEATKADYGQPIAQSTCEKIARDNITPLLRDPTSPIFSFAACAKDAAHSIPIANLPKQFGYGMAFTVNAKNGFGGYTGPKQYYVLIKDGVVIRRQRADDDGLGMFPF